MCSCMQLCAVFSMTRPAQQSEEEEDHGKDITLSGNEFVI